jgi:hypothetical protein
MKIGLEPKLYQRFPRSQQFSYSEKVTFKPSELGWIQI